MFTKFFTLLFLSLITFASAANFSVETSSWARIESYNQNKNAEHSHYINGQFVFKPEITLLKNLKAKARFELIPDIKDGFFFRTQKRDLSAFEVIKGIVTNKIDRYNGTQLPLFPHYRQTGFVVSYKGSYNGKNEKKNLSLLGLQFEQFYLEYENEIIHSRLGLTVPYHFGMGISYSNPEDDFLYHWFSAYDALDVKFKFSQFYLRPIIQVGFTEVPVMLEAGTFGEDWKLSVLLEQGSKLRPSNLTFYHLVEAFGEYQQDNWGFKASAVYNIKHKKDTVVEGEKDAIDALIAVEASVEIPNRIPTQLEIKAGKALGKAAFNPNYNVSLMHWNRSMETNESNQYSLISNGQINKGNYFSTNLNFSLMRNKLKVQPLFLVAIDDEDKDFYELNVNGTYKQNKNLSLVVKAGIHYDKRNEENPHSIALLAQGIFKY